MREGVYAAILYTGPEAGHGMLRFAHRLYHLSDIPDCGRSIEVREKSGFFVRPLLNDILSLPKQGVSPVKSHKVAINVLSSMMQRSLNNPNRIPFGEAAPANSLLPGKQMAAAVRSAAAGYQDDSYSGYGAPAGYMQLQNEISKRSLDRSALFPRIFT